MKSTKFLLFLLLFIYSLPFVSAQTNQPEVDVTLLTAEIDQDQIHLKVRIVFPRATYQTADSPLFFFTPANNSPLTPDSLNLPDPEGSGDQRKYSGEVIAEVSFSGWNRLSEQEKATAALTVGYQICDLQGVCYFPVEKQLLIADALDIDQPGFHRSFSFLTVIRYLLLAFVGGIILNIMPCVLPVLSLKALSLVNQDKSRKTTALKNASLYSAGILASMAVLALVVVLLKVGGEQVGWGFQFQNSGFVLFLVGLLVFFALSLFDLFIINLPGLTTISGLSGKGGSSGAFLSGIFAVLLATPCTAPVLGAALGFAFSAPTPLIPLFFLSVGAGLALPFQLLGFFPGLVKKLPKPGNWMNRFKEAMGFLLIAAALWLIDVLYYQIGWTGTVRTLIWLLIMVVSAWIYGKFVQGQKRRQRLIAGILVILLFAGSTAALFIPSSPLSIPRVENENGSSVQPTPNGIPGYERFTPEAVETALKNGEAVFINFSAKWCLTCQVNERTVLRTNEVQNLFKEKGVRLFYGDFTNYDSVIAQWLTDHGRAGVPLLLYYPPGERNPVILPEIITIGMIRDLF